MEAWNHESMLARKHGNMHGGEAWNDKESHLYRWNLAIIFTYGIMESWKYWSIEAWKHGSLEAWKHGSMETWKQGSMEALKLESLKHGSIEAWKLEALLKLSWRSLSWSSLPLKKKVLWTLFTGVWRQWISTNWLMLEYQKFHLQLFKFAFLGKFLSNNRIVHLLLVLPFGNLPTCKLFFMI